MISVIIPTYNRARILSKTLRSLADQTALRSEYEIIVVDDGSTDNTKRVVTSFIQKSSMKIRYYKQVNKGPSAARNLGIRQSRGRIILFLNDDTITQKNLIEEHIKIHNKTKGVAVLGLAIFPPELKKTDFMKFLEETQYHFSYYRIKDKSNCGFGFFYTSNISLEKKWLTDDLFDESFPYAAFEDTELGYRLEKRGLKIFFNKNAVVYHYHEHTPEQLFKKQIHSSRCLAYLLKKHKELKNVFIPPKKELLEIFFIKILFLILPPSKRSKRLKRVFWETELDYLLFCRLPFLK